MPETQPMTPDRRVRRLQVVRTIIEDLETDADNLDGTPLTGKEMARIFGELMALVQALAKIVESMLVETEIEPETMGAG